MALGATAPLASNVASSSELTLHLVLPNGATRDVPAGTLARDVVLSIGPGLLKAAIAVAIDGEVRI